MARGLRLLPQPGPSPSESFDAIYALESIGYTKDVDAWLAGCWRMLKPGGHLLIRSPGSLDHCRREKDYRSVTAFFDNWRYNFLGSNLLVYPGSNFAGLVGVYVSMSWPVSSSIARGSCV